MSCKIFTFKGFIRLSSVVVSFIVGGLCVMLWGQSYFSTFGDIRSEIQNQIVDVEKHLTPITYTVVLDSAIVSNSDIKGITLTLDSLVGVVKENQEWIIRRQETLVNDIRQETNNSIDKLALWSGFGICLIGLFGCLIPMFQSKINQDALEKNVDKSIEEAHSELKTYLEEYRREFASIKKECLDFVDKLRHQSVLHEVQDRAACMSLGLESKQVDNNEFLRVINEEVWRNMCQNFSKMVTIIREDLDKGDASKNRDNRFLLLTSLLRIEETLRRMSLRITDYVLLQDIQKIQDSLRGLTINVCGSTFIFDAAFMSSLDRLVRSLSLLNLRC